MLARRRSLADAHSPTHIRRRLFTDSRPPTHARRCLPTHAHRLTLADARSPMLADARSPTLTHRRTLPDAGSPSVEDVVSFGLIGGGNDLGFGLSLSLFRLTAWRFRRGRVQRLIIRFEGVRAVLSRQHVEIDFGLFVRFEFGTFQFRANVPLSPRHFSCFFFCFVNVFLLFFVFFSCLFSFS